MIVCTPSPNPVYDGDPSVTITCVLQNVRTDYTVIVKQNGHEVTPPIMLNTERTYMLQDSRYTIRTTNLVDRGDGTSSIWYHLEIANVNRDDAGLYVFEVLAPESLSVIISGTATLNVYYLPDDPPTCSPGEVYVVLGSPVPLICKINMRIPSSSYNLLWTSQSNVIPGIITESNGTITNTVNFVIPGTTTVTDLTCILSFDQTIFPDEESRDCQAGPVHIKTNPVLEVTPKIVTALPGQTVTFRCDIENDYIATRSWYSNSIPPERLLFGRNDDTDGRGLFIINVQPDDSGTITCRVNVGAVSFVEDSAQLMITSSPPPSLPPTSSFQNEQTAPITQVKHSYTLKTLGQTTAISSSKQSSITNAEYSPYPNTKNTFEESSNSNLSLSAIIGIVVCFVILTLFVILFAGFLLWKSKRCNKPSSHISEHDLHDHGVSSTVSSSPTTAENGQQSGTVLYADLDLTETPAGTDVRPPSEEPTVYASVKQQKLENIYIDS